MLEPGDAAPDFTLPGDDGKDHSLSDFAGKTLILYFYPKDLTPGCTTQACEFRDESPALKKRGALVVGVSPDSIKLHEKFKTKHELNFLLLSDEGSKVAKAYGAYGDKVLYGRKYKGIIRSTFVIDKKGKLISIERKVSPKGHAAQVAESLAKSLR
jgi:peroxiredoxin Q/BCP